MPLAPASQGRQSHNLGNGSGPGLPGLPGLPGQKPA